MGTGEMLGKPDEMQGRGGNINSNTPIRFMLTGNRDKLQLSGGGGKAPSWLEYRPQLYLFISLSVL